MPMPCSYCKSIEHTQFYCPTKPRKIINRKGKVTKQWIDTKTKWLERNKAPYYFCHYCSKLLTRSQLTLDHMEARSRRPDLRNSLSNLVPCCWNCNGLKGSLSHDEYIHTCNT